VGSCRCCGSGLFRQLSVLVVVCSSETRLEICWLVVDLVCLPPIPRLSAEVASASHEGWEERLGVEREGEEEDFLLPLWSTFFFKRASLRVSKKLDRVFLFFIR
jgi:hypothetical protein